jgi:hypothetical protein
MAGGIDSTDYFSTLLPQYGRITIQGAHDAIIHIYSGAIPKSSANLRVSLFLDGLRPGVLHVPVQLSSINYHSNQSPSPDIGWNGLYARKDFNRIYPITIYQPAGEL